MKINLKFVFPLILAIIIGFLSARIVYALYNSNEKEKYNAYFLQAGVYKRDINLEKKVKKLDSYIKEKDNDKNYIYVGITSKLENANKLKKVYEEKDFDIYIKKVYISNEEFISNLEQYDVLLSGVSKEDDLLSITKVILSSYEEIVLEGEET